MRVSDHAILRFAQHALELDIRSIEKQILAAVGKTDGIYPLGDPPLKARVINGVVVTVSKSERAYRRARVAKIRKAPPLVETGEFAP